MGTRGAIRSRRWVAHRARDEAQLLQALVFHPSPYHSCGKTRHPASQQILSLRTSSTADGALFTQRALLVDANRALARGTDLCVRFGVQVPLSAGDATSRSISIFPLFGYDPFPFQRKRGGSATSSPRRVSSSTNLLYPPSSHAFSAWEVTLICSSPEPSKKYSSLLMSTWSSLLLCTQTCILMISVRSRAVHHGGFASFTAIPSTSADGSVCGPVCCNGVPSGGGGALFFTHSGTALKGALCGVGQFRSDSGTGLTGGPSTLIFASHSGATLAPRFLERERETERRSAGQQFYSQTSSKVCCLPRCVVDVCGLISSLFVDVIFCVCRGPPPFSSKPIPACY